jgi:DNA-directed RNA polymerase specialized sigma24 family protein
MVNDDLGKVRRMERVLIGDAEAADDLVGEAIARTLPRWRAGQVDDCSAYVRQVVVNLASRRWRRLAAGRRRDQAASDWMPVAHDLPDGVAERDRTLRAVILGTDPDGEIDGLPLLDAIGECPVS